MAEEVCHIKEVDIWLGESLTQMERDRWLEDVFWIIAEDR
jgi:hypothetical protein